GSPASRGCGARDPGARAPRPRGAGTAPPAGAPARRAAKAWAGRFDVPTSRIVEEFTTSLPVDRVLYPHDITGSRAHVKALVRAKLLTPHEGRRLDAGLRRVLAELDAGRFRFRRSDEDVHMAIERRLTA